MKNYYLLSNGRLRRHDNTLVMENADGHKKPIPIEDVDSLYLYGEIDLNTKALTFLSSKKIPLHVFNYYGFYSGSYYPREYLHSGYLLVHQVRHYSDPDRRLTLVRELVRASAHSMLRNVAYYANRRKGDGTSLPDNDPDPTGEIGVETGSTPSLPQDAALEAAIDASETTSPVSEAASLLSEATPITGVGTDADPFESALAFEDDPSPLILPHFCGG